MEVYSRRMATVPEQEERSATPESVISNQSDRLPTLWEDFTVTPLQPVRTSAIIMMYLVLMGQILYGMAIKPAIEAARKEKAAAVKPADAPPAEHHLSKTAEK